MANRTYKERMQHLEGRAFEDWADHILSEVDCSLTPEEKKKQAAVEKKRVLKEMAAVEKKRVDSKAKRLLAIDKFKAEVASRKVAEEKRMWLWMNTTDEGLD